MMIASANNPLLVKFREHEYPVGYWAHRLDKGHLPVAVVASAAQIVHARRVLTRLARMEAVR